MLPRGQTHAFGQGLIFPHPSRVTDPAQLDVFRARFVTAFANPPAQAEVEFNPSLKAALFSTIGATSTCTICRLRSCGRVARCRN